MWCVLDATLIPTGMEGHPPDLASLSGLISLQKFGLPEGHFGSDHLLVPPIAQGMAVK